MRLVKIILVASLSIPNASVFGQSNAVSLLRTGPGVAFFTGSNATGSAAAFGFNIGVAPVVRLSERFYLKPEIALAKKGGRLEYMLPDVYSGF